MMTWVVSYASFFFQTELHTSSILYCQLLYGNVYVPQCAQAWRDDTRWKVWAWRAVILEYSTEQSCLMRKRPVLDVKSVIKSLCIFSWCRKDCLSEIQGTLTNRLSDALEMRKGWLETCGHIIALRVSSGGRRVCWGRPCSPLIYLPVSFCLSLQIFRCMAAIYFFIIIMHL